jgi:hypothetical protein
MLRYVHHLDPLLCLDNDLLPCVECDVSAFATQKHLQANIMCVYRNYVIYVRTIMRGVMCHPYYHYQEIVEILQGLCPDRHVLRVAVWVCLGCSAWELGPLAYPICAARPCKSTEPPTSTRFLAWRNPRDWHRSVAGRDKKTFSSTFQWLEWGLRLAGPSSTNMSIQAMWRRFLQSASEVMHQVETSWVLALFRLLYRNSIGVYTDVIYV